MCRFPPSRFIKKEAGQRPAFLSRYLRSAGVTRDNILDGQSSAGSGQVIIAEFGQSCDFIAVIRQLGTGEVLVLEDSLYALKTAKNAGYKTVGVYDKDGETDREGVKTTGDIYITELNELVDRWDELRK